MDCIHQRRSQKSDCTQGQHYWGDKICRGTRRTFCRMRQTNRRWSSWSSEKRCWCWDCKDSHQCVCFQADHPCWGRHKSSCTLAVPCSGVQMFLSLFPLRQSEIIRLWYQGYQAGAWRSSLQGLIVSLCLYWMRLGVQSIWQREEVGVPRKRQRKGNESLGKSILCTTAK